MPAACDMKPAPGIGLGAEFSPQPQQHMKTNPLDSHAAAQCSNTAQSFQKLASLRGISASIEWSGNEYIANGTPCGVSVHGLFDWLNAQPGVLP